MELNDVIKKRQSIRKFKEGTISDEEIIELIDLTINAPSAMNIIVYFRFNIILLLSLENSAVARMQ